MNIHLNANAIWQQLDLKDSKNDGKIHNSIWNEFADIVGGRHIKRFIEEKDALRSINTYLKHASEDVINKISNYLGWDNSETSINKKIDDANNLLEQIANDPSLISETQNGKEKDGTSWKKVKLSDGRAVMVKYAKDGTIDTIDVSTVVNKQRHYDGYYGDTTDIRYSENVIDVSNSDEVDYYSTAVSKEGYDFSKYKKLAEKFLGANIPEEAKYSIDNSVSMLKEFAKNPYKPKIYDIEYYGEQCKEARLSDGRFIRVFFNDNNEIETIMVSFDTTKNSDGKDGSEVSFTAVSANYCNDPEASDWSGEVKSGYDFEELKELAKKIFCKPPKGFI